MRRVRALVLDDDRTVRATRLRFDGTLAWEGRERAWDVEPRHVLPGHQRHLGVFPARRHFTVVLSVQQASPLMPADSCREGLQAEAITDEKLLGIVQAALQTRARRERGPDWLRYLVLGVLTPLATSAAALGVMVALKQGFLTF